MLTKAGYYAMQSGREMDAEHQQVMDISIATLEPMPFEAIGVTLTHSGIKSTDKARFTFELDSRIYGKWMRRRRGARLMLPCRLEHWDRSSRRRFRSAWKLTGHRGRRGADPLGGCRTVRVPANTQRLRGARHRERTRARLIWLEALESAMVVDGRACTANAMSF